MRVRRGDGEGLEGDWKGVRGRTREREERGDGG